MPMEDNYSPNPAEGQPQEHAGSPETERTARSRWGKVPREDAVGAHRDGVQPGARNPGSDNSDGPAALGSDQALGAAQETSRPRRQVGLGAALASGLVIALVAGALGGVVGGHFGGSSGEVVNSLDKAPIAGDKDPAATTPDGASVEEVAASVLPAVVSIQVVTATGGGEGSGSIISSDGLVLTNAHVAAEGGHPGALMQVTLNDGETHEAELVAADTATDIAVVKIKDVQGLPVMEFGDSSQLTVGQPVVAIGSPLGLSSTVTSGIVSALNRPVRAADGGGESTLIDAVQTDAAINPGNSGGPLVDLNGRLIGMNSVIASMSSGFFGSGQQGSIGLGFAIPSNFAQRVADQLVTDGEARQPMLGLQVKQDLRVKGAVVAAVPDGPARDAGLQEGDVITKVNDRVVDSADSLIAAVRTHDFGETVTLEVSSLDGQDEREVEVTLTGAE